MSQTKIPHSQRTNLWIPPFIDENHGHDEKRDEDLMDSYEDS